MKFYSVFFGSLLLAGGAVFADMTVRTGEVYSLTNSALIPAGVVTTEEGATIRVEKPAEEAPGWTVLSRDDFVSAGLACFNPGTYWGTSLDVFWATNLLATAPAQTWSWFGQWYVPEDAMYHFFECTADQVGLYIGGNDVILDGYNTGFSQKRNVSLKKGWHDIHVVMANSSGRFGGLVARGLLFSTNDVVYTLANSATNGSLFADPGDGSCFRQRHNGNFYQRLLLQGETTLDLTAHDLADPFRLIGPVRGVGEATLRVTGADSLRVGQPNTGSSVNFSLFDVADVRFDDEKGHIRFAGFSTLARPVSYPFEIEDGATLALWGTNTLGSGGLNLTNFNVTLLTETAVPTNETITIGAPYRLVVKYCDRNADDDWVWVGREGVFSHPVHLDGPGSILQLRGWRKLTCTGPVTGEGEIWNTDAGDFPVEMSGALDFTGRVVVASGELVMKAATPGVATNGVVLKAADCVFALNPAGTGTEKTVVSIYDLVGQSTNATLKVAALQTMTVAHASGSFTVDLEDETASVIFQQVKPDTRIFVKGKGSVQLQDVGNRVELIGRNGEVNSAFTLSVSETALLPLLTLQEGAQVTVHEGAILYVGGTGLVRTTGAVKIDGAARTISFRAVSGTLDFYSGEAAKQFATLRAGLWLDASAQETMLQYHDYSYTNGILVRRWNDCRPTQRRVYGLNPRGQGYQRVYPYELKNAVGDKSVLAFGRMGAKVYAPYSSEGEYGGEKETSGMESRRMPFNQSVRTRTAIMVFGSQFGGGHALLGGYGMASEYREDAISEEELAEWSTSIAHVGLVRGTLSGNKVEDANNPATPIFNADTYPVWVDGQRVQPSVTGFNGGYQVISMNHTDGMHIRSLGMFEPDGTGSCGGQIYGEVLLFTNLLSDVERTAVECYLARKWNVPLSSSEQMFVRSEFGATVRLLNPGNAVQVSGDGTLVVSGSYQPQVHYSGTVMLSDDAELHIPTREAEEAIWTESEIPTNGRVCWFDPECGESLLTNQWNALQKDIFVNAIFDRGKDRSENPLYLYGTDRRSPRLTRTTRGMGPERNWMFYQEPDDGDGEGNTLRLKVNPAELANGGSFSYVSRKIRTGFVVMDSSLGGGTPVIDTVNASGLVRPRVVGDSSAPIWPAESAALLRNGRTFLNGVGVNGTLQGFSGGPEVFSFTTTGDFPFAFLGYYGGSLEQSEEILGEALFFDSVLSDHDRAAIEAYLMQKWLGTFHPLYAAYQPKAVGGSGGVVLASLSSLPTFADGFSGSISVTGQELSFTIDSATSAVSPLLPVGSRVSVPAEGTVRVKFSPEVKPGTYPLIQCAGFGDSTFAGWSVVTEGATPDMRATLVSQGGTLSYQLLASGTLLLLR